MPKRYKPRGINPVQVEKFAGVLDELVGPEPTETSTKQVTGSGEYTYTREREVERQQLGPDEEQPAGHIEPMVNGVDFTSTRVAGYRYVPHDPNDSTDAGLGTIYMTFVRPGKAIGYQYENVPHAVYAAFSTDGVSKGKFINSTLNHFDYKPATDGLFFTF
jgi:hypothetical protein